MVMTTTEACGLEGVAAGVEVMHRFVEIDGTRIFYRDTGPVDGPTILLLHGFPTASHQFRRLIDTIGHRCRMVAPDYPGFGYSDPFVSRVPATRSVPPSSGSPISSKVSASSCGSIGSSCTFSTSGARSGCGLPPNIPGGSLG